jgi:hypothetical protein
MIGRNRFRELEDDIHYSAALNMLRVAKEQDDDGCIVIRGFRVGQVIRMWLR